MRSARGCPIPTSHFPYLLLLVSGGHCQLLLVEGVGAYRRLATTIDDAAGEAFDKTAKLLGLGFPGGPAVERAAALGRCRTRCRYRDRCWARPSRISRSRAEGGGARAHDAGNCRTRISPRLPGGGGRLPGRSHAARDSATVDATALVVAGGVAANGAVRAALEALAANTACRFIVPPLWLCTDNAAMIAWAGAERFAAGLTDPLDVAARPRWPLDPDAEAVRGAGVKA